MAEDRQNREAAAVVVAARRNPAEVVAVAVAVASPPLLLARSRSEAEAVAAVEDRSFQPDPAVELDTFQLSARINHRDREGNLTKRQRSEVEEKLTALLPPDLVPPCSNSRILFSAC